MRVISASGLKPPLLMLLEDVLLDQDIQVLGARALDHNAVLSSIGGTRRRVESTLAVGIAVVTLSRTRQRILIF